MKRSILITWLGLAVSVAPTFGSGYILLDNYDTYGPDIAYPSWWIPYGGQGLQPDGWEGPWTVCVYYMMGDVTKLLPPYPYFNTWDDPGDFGFVLGTGLGSTASVYYSAFDTPGEFIANSPFQIEGNPGDTITVVVAAYDGPSYAASWPTFPYHSFLGRGHSAPFTMTLRSEFSVFSDGLVGDFMPGFSVNLVIPEPGVLVLGGLGAAVLLAAGAKRGHDLPGGAKRG